MKLKHLVAGILTSSMGLSAQAATYDYAGYSLDIDTNIVTGGGLEWLQWDETQGLTIVQALETYNADGWRLASLNEMASVLNAFDFGVTFVGDKDAGTQYATGPAATGLLDTPGYDAFITIFGPTALGGIRENRDRQRRTSAFVGQDLDDNGYYGWVRVEGDYQQNNGVDRDAEMFFAPDAIQAASSRTGPPGVGDSSISDTGVALVRASPVPLPAAAWLFSAAVLGLGFAGRRKQQA
jgi:hypothetical protein